MKPEEARASKRPGEVLHQRVRKLPVNITTKTFIGGAVLITTAVGYYSLLYSRKKGEARALDVAKVKTEDVAADAVTLAP